MKLNIGLIILFLSSLVFAQKGDVTGIVKDAKSGEPLVGVNILVEHTTLGSATNLEGEYTIQNVPIGKFHLVASMIGYELGHEEVTIWYNAKTNVDFDLKETLLELGSVVVTGTSTPHIFGDSPVRTEVVPRKLIEQKFAINLAEALDLQTGVRVENNCNNCNFTQVRIYGLEGKYSQILIDDDPVMSSLAGVYGLEHFPEEMVSQIEIVKGGGSALYGGNAVAGVINLRTAKPMLNRTRIRYLGHSTGGVPDQRIGLISELANDKGNSGAYIFASTRQRSQYDHNDDGFSEQGELENESLGFKWYYAPSSSSELTAQLHRIYEKRRGGNMFELPVHEAQLAEETEHWRWGGSLKWEQRVSSRFDYRVYHSFALTKRTSFYGGLGDGPGWDSDENRLANLAAYGRTLNPYHVAGGKANYRIANHLLTGGLEYSYDKLEDTTIENPDYHINDTYTNFGIFLQDNLHMLEGEMLEFVLGARLDNHSEIENPIISPRFNTKLHVTESTTLRASFSTGFKAPQIFDEDLHIQSISGDQQLIVNDPNLAEEKSYSIAGGLDYSISVGDMPLLYAFSGFYTRLNDAFVLAPSPTTENPFRYLRSNSDGAKVYGLEMSLAIRPSSDLELRGGFTIKTSKYDSPIEIIEAVADENTNTVTQDAIFSDSFMRTPDLYANSTVSYNVGKNWQLVGSLNYTGDAQVPHAVPNDGSLPSIYQSDQYIDMDLNSTWSPPFMSTIGAKITLGVKNITNSYQKDLDIGAGRDPSYIYGPRLPRTVFVGFETAI
jgi:outer membrane receptor for ferrienterochelin and colicins